MEEGLARDEAAEDDLPRAVELEAPVPARDPVTSARAVSRSALRAGVLCESAVTYIRFM